MKIKALGMLDVRVNGVDIAPTAPKPRQVLALLALHADRVVPVSALIDELWAARPPRSARTTLQTYILRLRELITPALGKRAPAAAPPAPRSAKDVLVTEPGGYRLALGGGTSDVREFERLAGIGYRAADAGDFRQASRLLVEALALWAGPAFADVQTGAQLEMEVRRLAESRLCALDRRIEADLQLGRHRELLAELTVLTSRYRTHENLHAQFMLALHRSGRRGGALEVYQCLRAALMRDLGLEPSARLRRLQQSILTAAPEVSPEAGPRAPAAESSVRAGSGARPA
ncbi:AfsR/SARP family transcriptional regulator [Streptomyces coriariae]|uniref:AfsR/SARP family transcriptional regulator n=1 Tax=Streptomyces coriariae TaxID=2864460 RepID=UPI001E2C52A0|nr:AfsR/SARP family transcriptional regulator [Streptomyces coriariae]